MDILFGASNLEVATQGSKAYLTNLLTSVSKEFQVDRCMLYLFDEATSTLRLNAVYGYPNFGRATIVSRLGEGLSGRALAERRTIYTETAASMRGYREHPNFPDGDVQTYLGLPLLRGRERIGVFVLRRRTGRPFLAEEISAIRTKIAELTPSIQNAAAIALAEEQGMLKVPTPRFAPVSQTIYRGIAVSNGWAMGPARILKASELWSFTEGAASVVAPNAKTLPPAVRTLDEGIALVEECLKCSARELEKRLPEAANMIFEADIMMLHDESFTGKIRQLTEDGKSLPEAITLVATEFMKIFAASENDYLREKVRDIEDLTLLLLEAVTQADAGKTESIRASSVVIAEKILPSDVLRFARDHVSGVILCAGGATAHVTLLVRSLRIPMLIIKATDLLKLPENERVILDCANETAYIHPEEDLIKRFSNRSREENLEVHSRLRAASDSTFTHDNVRITLQANINILADLDAALDARAEGIGLYRTEFPFLMRPSLPSEADQIAIYSHILKRMPTQPVTFRTLDAGGDKVIPYLYKVKEENPALGLRSIRFSLKYPYILDQQLRAILHAMQTQERDDISIMFPMISSVEEFREASRHVEACISALHTELGDRPLFEPYIGTMIEVPAVLGVLDKIAEESDFFSIGTNDLIQYILAADRTNESVAASYIGHHPAVLRALKLIADTALRHDIPCCVCGEMGRDPRYLPFLIGVGIRQFSLEPAQIAKSQQLISRLTIAQCEAYAAALLRHCTLAEIQQEIDDFSRRTFG